MKDEWLIKQAYKANLQNNIVKSARIVTLIGLVVLSYYVFSDLFFRSYSYTVYTRIIPILAALTILFLTFQKDKNKRLILFLYNLMLVTIPIMMYIIIIIYRNDIALGSSVNGAILVIFIVSLLLQTTIIRTTLIYFVPMVLFIVFALFVFDFNKNNFLPTVNIYPMVFLGFATNIVQNKLKYNKFKSGFLLEQEKKKTEKLYEETLAQNELLNSQNKEITEQKKIIEQNTYELQEKNEKIEKAHNSILDGVKYASRIQDAMFRGEQDLTENVSEYFIFLQPKEAVSGDFYWGKQIYNELVIVAADCTGHGIPGAFVSTLGISMLNEIFSYENQLEANEILEKLRFLVKSSLNQENITTNIGDGMDMSLCILNTETLKMQYAGANSPLYLYSDNEIQVFKPTKNPIGIYPLERPFVNNLIQLKKGDTFYMFSDGYSDQLGGSNYQKFSKVAFRDLLKEINTKPLKEQKITLEQTINVWMKEKSKQTDDILVIGIKI